MLHQTQSSSGPVGQFEWVRIQALQGSTATTDRQLTHSYRLDGGETGQAVVVAEYASVDIQNNGRLHAPARVWHQRRLACGRGPTLRRNGGTIDMNSTGYRGVITAGAIAARKVIAASRSWASRARVSHRMAWAAAAAVRVKMTQAAAVAVTATGSNGANGGCGACRQACPIPGGRGGSVASDNLRSTIFFGGSGGEGGADEDGCHPGRGGNGGGIIIAHASSVQIEGTVRAGGQGGSGGNSGGCGSGCGMGGGGGGAGGAVRIASASDATLGTNRITVSGGGGGRATCGARRLGRSGTHRCARTERVRVLEPAFGRLAD